MTAYYNENDPYAAQWLRNLIDAGHIAHGLVDTRSIVDVQPSDLHGFVQCHFFAGIGVWSLALRSAGWPDSRPAWTGSCPCQPFSAAGKGAGFADERHLWPAWQHLIAQCRPAVIFGEQVASKDAEPWIDLVHADLEGMGYAFGCVAFPSAGVGAPHIRDRNYWVADASGKGLAQRISDGRVQREAMGALARQAADCSGAASGLADAKLNHRGCETATTDNLGPEANRSANRAGGHCGTSVHQPGAVNGFWRAADWLGCTDGKWRPVEPGTFPLAHGITNRVGRLRAYGNAIVPQVAAEVIAALMECIP